MADYVVGVDPGKTGGLVCIDQIGALVWQKPMPENPVNLIELLVTPMGAYMDGAHHVFVEKAQAMPKNGAVSMFNYGTHFGILQGILIAYAIPYTLIPPQTWTKVMHMGTKGRTPKNRALEAAQRLCPAVTLPATSRARIAHDGIVDAYLIAEYGRRYLRAGGV